ncbi:MAG: WGR domain-containing protein [Planctomycetota bacterium]|nr:WGR domain-containing protein [Planctomycetota bacterium]
MSAQTPSKSITLYFREGSSDKVYQAGIEPKGAGFVVNFAYGRRGTTLQTGTKTAKPVDYQSALSIYDKLVKEKMAKGYTPGQDGTPYQGTERQPLATGVFPQLLNPIDQDQAARLVLDDDWWMQEKFDGYAHIMIMRSPLRIPIWNALFGSPFRELCFGRGAHNHDVFLMPLRQKGRRSCWMICSVGRWIANVFAPTRGKKPWSGILRIWSGAATSPGSAARTLVSSNTLGGG